MSGIEETYMEWGGGRPGLEEVGLVWCGDYLSKPTSESAT